MIKFICDKAHYAEVLARVPKVKRSIWIGTADIKDLYVKVGSKTEPFLAVLAQLIKMGVEVRLIHAKEPPAFYEGGKLVALSVVFVVKKKQQESQQILLRLNKKDIYLQHCICYQTNLPQQTSNEHKRNNYFKTIP